MDLRAILEGLLFVVGDEGIALKKVALVLEITEEEALSLMEQLIREYESDTRGIQISYLGNIYKLTTKKEHKEYYKKLVEEEMDNGLSGASLEVLAITAYNQPVTRLDIDKIRGIYSGPILRKLVAKGMIMEIGRSESPGRPILYGTTNEFLDYFNLSSMENLPKIEINLKEERDDAYLFQVEKE